MWGGSAPTPLQKKTKISQVVRGSRTHRSAWGRPSPPPFLFFCLCFVCGIYFMCWVCFFLFVCVFQLCFVFVFCFSGWTVRGPLVRGSSGAVCLPFSFFPWKTPQLLYLLPEFCSLLFYIIYIDILLKLVFRNKNKQTKLLLLLLLLEMK